MDLRESLTLWNVGSPPLEKPEREEILATARILKWKRIQAGINSPLRLTLEDKSKAIAKPYRRKVTDVQGRNELLAYEIARVVGVGDLVPAVVSRKIAVPFGIWRTVTLMDWVDGKSGIEASMEDVAPGDVCRAAVFDYVIANTDRHRKNWIVGADGRLWLIDHGLAFGGRKGNRPKRTHARMILAAREREGNRRVGEEWVRPYRQNQQRIAAILQMRGVEDRVRETVLGRIRRLPGMTWKEIVAEGVGS